jgi:hypothetical protein
MLAGLSTKASRIQGLWWVHLLEGDHLGDMDGSSGIRTGGCELEDIWIRIKANGGHV